MRQEHIEALELALIVHVAGGRDSGCMALGRVSPAHGREARQP